MLPTTPALVYETDGTILFPITGWSRPSQDLWGGISHKGTSVGFLGIWGTGETQSGSFELARLL